MASAYLTKTLGTPTNNKKFTFSCWVKKSNPASTMDIFHAGPDGSNEAIMCRFESNGQLTLKHDAGGSQEMLKQTTALFRDPNAWYHIVIVFDTDNSTAEDRQIIYVNGERITDFASNDNFAGGEDILGNKAVSHTIGKRNFDSANYLDGVLTHVHFADGQAYAPTVFGETDATTGIWKPKVSPSVTYGNNGFFLKMDNSANMGLDSSGNSNNWTTNGTIIQTKDTPSNVFATINPLDNFYQNNTFSNINNTVASHSSSYSCCLSTLGVSKGKYYVEAKVSALTAAVFGVTGKSPTSTGNNLGTSGFGIGVGENGRLRHEGTNTDSWSSTYTTNDILQIALDLDNNKFYFGINGTYQNSANPSSGTNGVTILAPSSTDTGFYFFGFSDNNSSGGSTLQYNFGNGYFGTTAVASAQTPDDGVGVFEYDPPTGYRALCTKSINAEEYS